MFESIEEYLVQLKSELAGCDPATVQDALSDAEEYLRSAMVQAPGDKPGAGEGELVARIVEDYGAPADIAAAYRDIEVRVQPVLAPRPMLAATVPGTVDDRPLLARFFGVLVDPRAYAALFYMLFSLITGILYFTWATVGLSLSFGLIVLIIGLPFILVFLLSIQGVALVEGRLIEALLGERMPRRPLFSSPHLGFWGRLRALVTDKLSWTTLLYMIVQLPLGCIYFTVFLFLLMMGLWGFVYPVLRYVLGFPYMQINDWMFYPAAWMYPVVMLVSVLWIVLTLHLARILGRAHAGLAKLLLVRD